MQTSIYSLWLRFFVFGVLLTQTSVYYFCLHLLCFQVILQRVSLTDWVLKRHTGSVWQCPQFHFVSVQVILQKVSLTDWVLKRHTGSVWQCPRFHFVSVHFVVQGSVDTDQRLFACNCVLWLRVILQRVSLTDWVLKRHTGSVRQYTRFFPNC